MTTTLHGLLLVLNPSDFLFPSSPACQAAVVGVASWSWLWQTRHCPHAHRAGPGEQVLFREELYFDRGLGSPKAGCCPGEQATTSILVLVSKSKVSMLPP